MVDYSQLDADLAAGTVPDYVFITPNLINDMHDGSIAQGDAWLSREVPKILASDALQERRRAVPAVGRGRERTATTRRSSSMSPNAKPGFVSQVDYDTSSFLKTVQAILGLEPLPCAQQPDAVPTMDDLFTVPLGQTTAPGTGP